MIVFAFPPQAALDAAPYWLSGTDYSAKTAAGTLVVVPPGCQIPDAGGAPVFCMDEAAPGQILDEAWAAQRAAQGVWISSRLSGGTLRERLSQALEQYQDRLWLRVEPVCMRFPMPCPTAEGRTLTQQQSAAIRSACPAFYCPEFCCMYCVQFDGAQAFMHLFDTTQTIAEKLALANELGVPYAFGDIPLEAI